MSDSPAFDRVILGDLVLPDRVLRAGWIAVRGEAIAAIGQGAPPSARAAPLDHTGRLVFPGLVDGHMHTSSAIGWAGIEGATRTAAAGGVTTCVDMPYDEPAPVTNAAMFQDKIGWVNRTAHVDVALYATILKEGGTHHIPELAQAGACSFKMSTYETSAHRFPRISHAEMLKALRLIAETGLPVSVHNEDQEIIDRLTAEAKAAGRTENIMHAKTRPPISETLADVEIFELALETGAHVHIAHSSLARGFDLAAIYREAGARASAEACIQYLCLTEDDLARIGAKVKCNPPVRSAAEVERMWDRLQRGTMAYISTDHAPWPLDRKTRPQIFDNGSGLTGLQTFAPLMYTLLVRRGLPLTLLAKYCAEATARHHGLFPKKGAIMVGADCDLCVLEPADYEFDEASIVDRPENRWSAFHGMTMKAKVAATILRGRVIWDGAAVLARPGDGRFVPRLRSAAGAA